MLRDRRASANVHASCCSDTHARKHARTHTRFKGRKCLECRDIRKRHYMFAIECTHTFSCGSEYRCNALFLCHILESNHVSLTSTHNIAILPLPFNLAYVPWARWSGRRVNSRCAIVATSEMIGVKFEQKELRSCL